MTIVPRALPLGGLAEQGTRINQIIVETETAKSLGNSEVLIPGNRTNPSILKTDTPPPLPNLHLVLKASHCYS